MEPSTGGKIYAQSIPIRLAEGRILFRPANIIIWNGFLHVIGWICKALCWKVGSGRRVLIGIDPVAGMEDNSALSRPLIRHLNDIDIVTLDHIHRPSIGCVFGSNWLKAVNLGLDGPWKAEWDLFTAVLRTTGIKLNNENDTLIWSYNKNDGQVTAPLGLYLHCWLDCGF